MGTQHYCSHAREYGLVQAAARFEWSVLVTVLFICGANSTLSAVFFLFNCFCVLGLKRHPVWNFQTDVKVHSLLFLYVHCNRGNCRIRQTRISASWQQVYGFRSTSERHVRRKSWAAAGICLAAAYWADCAEIQHKLHNTVWWWHGLSLRRMLTLTWCLFFFRCTVQKFTRRSQKRQKNSHISSCGILKIKPLSKIPFMSKCSLILNYVICCFLRRIFYQVAELSAVDRQWVVRLGISFPVSLCVVGTH